MAILVIAAVTAGFAWGGNNRFVNASSGPVSIHYRSTTGSYSGDVIRGGGLRITTDSGELISVKVTYRDNHIVKLDAGDVRRLKAMVVGTRGVWWVEDSGVSYISSKEASTRQRRLFGKM